MAFTVTPTSGDAPYTLSADIDKPNSVDGVHYVASILQYTSTGSCSMAGSGFPMGSTTVNSLVADGSVVLTTATIADGSCRTLLFEITRVSDGVVVSSMSATINNV